MTESVWGRPGFEKEIHEHQQVNTLQGSLGGLSLATRRKIYAYVQKGGLFKRGTWDGCVMNAASGGIVQSFSDAAVYFGESEHKIMAFVHAWDATRHSLTDLEATRKLESLLLEVGLTPVSPKFVSDAKVYRVRLFTSKETAMVEELRAEIEAGAFDADIEAMKELCFA